MGSQKSKLTPADLEELSKQTEFSEHEIQAWFKSFRKDCPSGKLTFNEFEKLYKDFFPEGDATEFAKHAFRTFDDNNDGTIDFREFMCALSVTSRGSFEDKISWAYSMYDQDHDGHLTKKEMLDIMAAIYKMVGEKTLNQLLSDGLTPEQRVDHIFERMDKDGDEKITLSEFKTAAVEDPSLVMLLQTNQCNSQEENKQEKVKKKKK